MTEEEKKAIETMQHWIEYEKANKEKIIKADELIEIQETVLNLIQKQNKVIDEMAEWISNVCFYVDDYGNSCEVIQDSCYKDKDCKNCIKEYFINKAKEEK